MIVEECVHAYSSAGVTTARDGVFHSIPMDTEVVDSGGFHNPASNPSRLTFPAGGIFLVFGAPSWDDTGSSNVNSRLAKNGTSVGYEYNAAGFAPEPTGRCGPPCFWLDQFLPADYMESQGSATHAIPGGAYTQMAALKVSDWSCSVGATASVSAPAFGNAVLTFPTVHFDPHGMATATDRITCQKAGYYLLLSNARGESVTRIQKNGLTVALHGSRGGGHDGQSRNATDYTVAWLDVGDYVRVHLFGNDRSLSVSHRQFAAVYLGSTSAVSYTYSAVDLHNSDAGFTVGKLRTDSEFIDSGDGHPKGGFIYNPSPAYCISCGSFDMTAGYHFAMVKIMSSGGFASDGVYTRLNGTALQPPIVNTRHVGENAIVGFVCFAAAAGDEFTANWLASGTVVQTGTTPTTNVFVTDAGTLTKWVGQIYRRL